MGSVMMSGVAPNMTVPVTDIKARNIAVGSTVKLLEKGVATEYLVVNQGIPSGSSLYDASCDGMWLLRKDVKEKRQWHNVQQCIYSNSDINTYLNGEFLNLFDAVTKSCIKQVKIPYFNGTDSTGSYASGANGLPAKVFLLSSSELGDSYYAPDDGALLSYFISGNGTEANNKRIVTLDGSTVGWWTRSVHIERDFVNVISVYPNGVYGTTNPTAETYAVRPALILPSTALFDKDTLILKGVA